MSAEHRVRSVCIGNNLRHKGHRDLYTSSIRKGSGTFIDETTILQTKVIGSSWTELEVVNPGNSDCEKGTRITAFTDLLLEVYEVDGYDTCPHCKGAGVIKHDFRSF